MTRADGGGESPKSKISSAKALESWMQVSNGLEHGLTCHVTQLSEPCARPKPTAVLRARGIVPTVSVPEPDTWHEVVDVLARRAERKLAIQEYGRPNVEFVKALEALGATVETFALYKWELPEDT